MRLFACFKTMLYQHTVEGARANATLNAPRSSVSETGRSLALRLQLLRSSLISAPFISGSAGLRTRTPRRDYAVRSTTCCRGNANCLWFADSQWERGGQSGVFLPAQGHPRHTHRPGRQTCK